ncbi:uncharacterized protein K452DRAFT_283047 [Aplosporella prunicola CBS 121167]|uniref:Pentacotripeptide-repeat region of PRORP domain-containing protein n=1 Tax=Aplosporella prunicola CBS 121167 TaxID=1176127 RepID=A0A6A6BTZ0_9PEZI|nr:uncharacterized protein K452DRAFT_283047 [Aplosporella prunicola CBS 121167]KAF2146843.1 hypothetical protein K452DRAFT_283047 [Aplosporella prunicola CBS 121167]
MFQLLNRIPPHKCSRLPLRRSLAATARPRPWWSILSSPREETLEGTLEEAAGGNAAKGKLISFDLQPRLMQAQKEVVTVHRSYRCSRHKQVMLLNKFLLQAYDDPKDEDTRKNLWKWYCHAKFSFPEVLDALPDKAWDILWNTQSQQSLSNANSMEHLKQLVEDMRTTGRTATTAQQLAHIEATFLEGKREEALQQWEQGYDISLGQSVVGRNPEFMELGLRMWSVAGNPDRAQKVLIELFAMAPKWDPRVIVPVFEAHIQKGRDKNINLAWALYTHMKYLLGDKMTLEDYEKCYLGFLYRKKQQHALAVFKEMMLLGQKPGGEDAGKFKSQILSGFDSLPAVCRNASEVNETFLHAVTALPREWQNKFFFGKWLKRLIGMGELESAAQVIEFMFESGIKPDARHLNGLMGAWFRSGITQNIEKAESLGLQMVRGRMNLVRERSANETNRRRPAKSNEASNRSIELPVFIERPIPPATSETFGVLLEIYLHKRDWNKVDDLRNWQSEAQLRMNVAAMNSFLAFYIERGQYLEVWKQYKDFTDPANNERVIPDEATYAYLWATAHARWVRSGMRDYQYLQRAFPTNRAIMKETLAWLNSVPNKAAAASHLMQRNKVYHRIVECFCLEKDLPGALVALHAFKANLGVYPDQHTATILAKYISRIGFRARSPAQRREVARSMGYLKNVSNVLQVLEALFQRRARQLVSEGKGEMSKEEKDELFLNVLSELIRVVLVRREEPGTVEHRIWNAKKKMGVREIETGDIDAFNVS